MPHDPQGPGPGMRGKGCGGVPAGGLKRGGGRKALALLPASHDEPTPAATRIQQGRPTEKSGRELEATVHRQEVCSTDARWREHVGDSYLGAAMAFSSADMCPCLESPAAETVHTLFKAAENQ